MTTFTKEQLAVVVSDRATVIHDGGSFSLNVQDLARFTIAQMQRADSAEVERDLNRDEIDHLKWESERIEAEIETLRAIALTAEHLCKYDGSKAMTAKGHYYDAQKAMEFSDRLHELLAEWRKGQKEGRW